MKQKILILNNSLAAMKFIYSIKKTRMECVFFGLATSEDFKSAYINFLDDFEVLPSGESSLNFSNIDAILKAALKFKVDLVWPGWGFLSENSILPKILHENGIGFIGPSEKSMKMLGDKYSANILCEQLKISHIPFLKVNIKEEIALNMDTNINKTHESQIFSLSQIQNFLSLDETKQEKIIKNIGVKNLMKISDLNIEMPKDTARFLKNLIKSNLAKEKHNLNEAGHEKTEIDQFIQSKEFADFLSQNEFPLLIKLSLSGGGKGIRIVKNISELRDVYETVKAEGSGEIILCKIVKNARHVELQMARDKHGNVKCLGGRDCTIQRRHQKLIEESLIIDDDIYEEIEDCGKKLMNAVSYEGIATIEFLLCGRKYYFLEVNTRIQVEHPVTELDSNINIPEIQLIIANGGSIKKIKHRKHTKHVLAIRVVSEDPWNDFLPVSGDYKVSFINQPKILACFTSNHGTIGKFTDSQFGHIFSISKTRNKCIKLMLCFLSNLRIEGITTNVPFIIDLLQTDFFSKREYDIKTIENIMIVHKTSNIKDLQVLFENSSLINRFDQNKKINMISTKLQAIKDTKIKPFVLFAVVYANQKTEKFQELEFIYENEKYEMKIYWCSTENMILEINGSYLMIKFLVHGDKYFIHSQNMVEIVSFRQNGDVFSIIHTTGAYKFILCNNSKNILAPTDGKIIKFFKSEGDHIEANENFVEIEIMKMRLCVSSPFTGTLRLSSSIDSFIKENDPLGYVESDIRCSNENSNFVFCKDTAMSPQKKNLIRLGGILIENTFLTNIFKGYRFPKEIFRIISDSNDLNPNILLEYISEFCSNKCVTEEIDLFINAVLISINRFFDLHDDDYKLYKSLLELLELIDCIIIEKKLSNIIYNGFVELKLRLANYKFKKANFFYNEKVTEQNINEYIQKNCCYKEGILFTLTHLKGDNKAFIKKYLNDAFGNIYKDFNLHDQDSRQFSFSHNSKIFTGLFYICEKRNCKDFKFEQDIVLHYNCNEPCFPNHFFIKTQESAPHIAYLYKGKLYQSDEIIHSIIVNKEYEESKLVYKDIFRNLSINLVSNTLEIIYKIDTHSRNSVMNVKDLSHAIKEILCAIIITRKRLGFVKGKFMIFVIGKIQIPSEYILRIVDDCMFYYSLNFIKNGIIECQVIYRNNVENKIIHRVTRGVMEKLVYSNDSLIEYKVENNVIFSSDKVTEKIADFVHSQVPLENKEREIARKNNTLYPDDFIYLFSLIFHKNNTKFACEELYLEDTTQLCNNEITNRYSYNDKTYFLSSNYKRIGIRGFLITYDSKQFILILNDITYKNGSFSIPEYIFYTLVIRKAKNLKCPFVFIATNSGAQIGLYDKLKNIVEYKNNAFTFDQKDDGVILNKGRIISISGNDASGPENLSFSGLLASETVEAYEKILTLSYVSGRSVGIGAYLNKLGERIIQKSNSSILLTGYQALNKLLQSKVYNSNNEIGGIDVMNHNGNNHLTVENDFLGVTEILRWIDYYFTSGQNKKINCQFSPRNVVFPTKEGRLSDFLNKYNSIEFNESHNEREILEVVLDPDTMREYKTNYAPNIILGRGKVHGQSIGIISTESDSSISGKNITKHVLFPDSSDKIAQGIRDFSNESLNILIIANYKGFTGGKKEMEENVLKHGSEIVRSLYNCKTKVIFYIPPCGQVRGGSWVVFDKNINQKIKIFAHPNSEVGIMQPDAVCDLKFKEKERIDFFERVNEPYTVENGFRMGVEFCKLHDSVARMHINGMVDQIVFINELRGLIQNIFNGQ